ncbi:E3 SUMO-protein ligase SIZ1 [Candida viswanathii]|uniref:E3 SUMO-protein ligase SIZ1 n=1 Tax=Candida viswanathii TaxID=5486 RepID=A0A367XSG2_9ASCO|nr:E3 SUMO-protein ligase SIZ1 [Candida viswanathii]
MGLPPFTKEDIANTLRLLKLLRVADIKLVLGSLRMDTKCNKKEAQENLQIYFEQGIEKNDNIRLHALRFLMLWRLRKKNSTVNYGFPTYSMVYDRMKMKDATILSEYANLMVSDDGQMEIPREAPRLPSKGRMQKNDSTPMHGIHATFKENPFYKLEYQLQCSPHLILGVAKGENEEQLTCVEILFTLTREEMKQLRHPDYRLYMVCTNHGHHVQKKQANADIDYPSDSKIFLNREQMYRPSDTLPVDLTASVLPYPKSNHLTIEYSLKSDPLMYFMHFFIARKIPAEDILDQVLAKPPIQKQTTIAKHRDAFDGITSTDAQYSLNDPISGKRMKYPAQGMFCDHVTCFDAADYIKYLLEHTYEPNCCCCLKGVVIEELRLVQFFQEIIESTDESITSVTVNAVGEWSYEKHEVVDLSDDDTGVSGVTSMTYPLK